MGYFPERGRGTYGTRDLAGVRNRRSAQQIRQVCADAHARPRRLAIRGPSRSPRRHDPGDRGLHLRATSLRARRGDRRASGAAQAVRRLESPGASIATLIILFPIAAGFAVAAAIGAGGSAWLALALGAVGGAVAGCTLALRRWNDPYVGGSIRGGVRGGGVGGNLARQTHPLSP